MAHANTRIRKSTFPGRKIEEKISGHCLFDYFVFLSTTCLDQPNVLLFVSGTFIKHSIAVKTIHCPNTNTNLRVKTEPITDGADATVNRIFGARYMYVHKSQTYNFASAPAVISSVFRFQFVKILF